MDKQALEPSRIASHFAPWDQNDNVIWLASTLGLHRNIEKFQFPHKLDAERKKQLLGLISKAILSEDELSDPYIVKAEDLLALERDFLLEHFLIFEGFSEARQGEAFALDQTGQFIALLNLKDHVQLQLTDTTGDLEKAWAHLMAIENGMAPVLNFAFSSKFGFLTPDPMHCGTGLVISAYLHLPTLIHLNMLQELLEKEKNEAILHLGLQGNPEELIGDILVIRNSYTIGVNEETIISTLRNAILKFLVAEKSARASVKGENNTIIKDKISRALGVLKYSYRLETVEALAAISLVKLGIEIGWIKEMGVREINDLFFNCRRGHLCYHLKEKVPNEEMASRRASFLRKRVENLIICS